MYNSNTSLQRMQANSPEEMRGPSSRLSGQSSQWGLDVWSGDPSRFAVTKTMSNVNNNATFNPYMGHLSIFSSPNVQYGPMELINQRSLTAPGTAGGAGMNAYAEAQSNIRYIVKAVDPLGRSTGSSGIVGKAGAEISFLQLDQTMREIKNRAAIETTAAYNRNIPPTSRVTAITPVETIMEKILPGVSSDARTQIIVPTRMALPLGASPNVMSGSYYNLVTGEIEGFQQGITERAFQGRGNPPEVIEDLFQENMLWKQNMYHGADYKEGPSTKDKTKETIKTIKATGELVTTDIGDNAFTKNKEFEKADVEGEKKQASLQEKMDKKRKTGFLMGMNP